MKTIPQLIGYAAETLCEHYHHIFCEQKFATWEDWSCCYLCNDPCWDENEEETHLPLSKYDHEFYPDSKPLGFPFPQIQKIVIEAMFLGAVKEETPDGEEA